MDHYLFTLIMFFPQIQGPTQTVAGCLFLPLNPAEILLHVERIM